MFNPTDSIIYHLNEPIGNFGLPIKPKVKLKPHPKEIKKISNGIFRESNKLNKVKNEQLMTKKSKLETQTNTVFENLIDENKGTLNDNFEPLNDASLQGTDEVAVLKTYANSPSTCASVVATTERMNSNHELEIPLFASDKKEYCINSN
jgi:hypothetical protein